jgi:hypothetical protein
LLAAVPAIVEPIFLPGSDIVFSVPLPDLVVVIFDASAMVRIVLPLVRGDLWLIDVDLIVFVDVDIDVAAAPVAVTPAPDG